MNTISRTISGIALVIFGAYIAGVSYSEQGEGWIFGLVWGLFIIGVGVYIFFNKKEDDIEKIKDNQK